MMILSGTRQKDVPVQAMIQRFFLDHRKPAPQLDLIQRSKEQAPVNYLRALLPSQLTLHTSLNFRII